MAAGNALSASAINSQIAADAIRMKNDYLWLKDRYHVWSENAGTATLLNNGGISVAADQNQILAVIAAMNLLIQMYEGTAAASTVDNIFAIDAVRGCN